MKIEPDQLGRQTRADIRAQYDAERSWKSQNTRIYQTDSDDGDRAAALQ